MRRVARVSGFLALLLGAGCSIPPALVAPLGTFPPLSQVDGALGTRSSAAVPAALKIGLAVAESDVAVAVHAAASAGDVALAPGKTYVARRAGAKIVLAEGQTEVLRADPPLEIRSDAAVGLGFGGRRYRGSFQLIAPPGGGGGVTLINAVPPEDYLYGVLPAEMATGWLIEALKAQAVAARTYAIANLGRRAALGFDLYDTTADQVYKGFTIEKPDTNSAVDGTRGQVLTWQERPIAAFFHASSGGETDDAVAVWGQDLPYIQGVVDLDPSPHARWSASFDAGTLGSAIAALGSGVGTLQGLTVSKTTPHGRARWLEARGTAGTATVDANALRMKLGLKSTRYLLTREGAGYKFAGGGWGHGLGMSQWGARAYAQQGEGYQAILARYYADTTLK
ncbi:MAG: SpoIID/LytB domain-containing protein [Candidatus Sericytochromatia bacterium]|nr:SpoIID/LytB domain-containing protein [Candidatus Tanganyikabacteria bacterium]